MTPEFWAILIGTIVTVVSVLGAAFYTSGKLAGNVTALDGRMTKNEDTDGKQWETINDHETRISKIQGHLGVNGT